MCLPYRITLALTIFARFNRSVIWKVAVTLGKFQRRWKFLPDFPVFPSKYVSFWNCKISTFKRDFQLFFVFSVFFLLNMVSEDLGGRRTLPGKCFHLKKIERNLCRSWEINGLCAIVRVCLPACDGSVLVVECINRRASGPRSSPVTEF